MAKARGVLPSKSSSRFARALINFSAAMDEPRKEAKWSGDMPKQSLLLIGIPGTTQRLE
eukprot:CAMPEP_0176088758 /NCGR_PEP_ID=MMETSP0120_2-20121206/44443_1 /TAXON_ID=160619 /ORGANISM="Kryptoperidinium foliaceum, Strain CCMP 1326" /LENGTH=58 /DNA_ID=CAMNT_0017422619 /DNA_START=22 /DNA_END=195 /DNA_ORIENTATION=+